MNAISKFSVIAVGLIVQILWILLLLQILPFEGSKLFWWEEALLSIENFAIMFAPALIFICVLIFDRTRFNTVNLLNGSEVMRNEYIKLSFKRSYYSTAAIALLAGYYLLSEISCLNVLSGCAPHFVDASTQVAAAVTFAALFFAQSIYVWIKLNFQLPLEARTYLFKSVFVVLCSFLIMLFFNIFE